MTHLDAVTWRDLVDGRLDAEAVHRLTDHLDSGCDVCEAVVAAAAERGEVDALDGVVDETLLALSEQASAEAVDEVGFARLRRQLRRRRRRWLWAGGAIAATAAALLAALAVLMPQPVEMRSWRVKGVAPVAPQEVQLEVLRSDAGVIAPLARGAEVALDTTLVFRVRLQAPACVQLWLERRPPQALLGAPLCLQAGSHVLAAGGEALGFAADTPGRLEFRLAAQEGQSGGDKARFSLEVVSPER